MTSITGDKRMLRYESLSSYPNIFHSVTTRQGGCSKGSYASFNRTSYSRDEAEKARRNRTLLMEGVSQTLEEPVIPVQTHEANYLLVGDVCLSASSQQRQEMLHGMDALITRELGYCLCIPITDCVPMLMYDKKRSAIAAAHAGQRGTIAYIVRDTLLRMEKELGTNGEDVVACIGPGISLTSFEMGEEVYEAFQKNGLDTPRISAREEEIGKHHTDLWEASRMRIPASGAPPDQVELVRMCMYIRHDEFFSTRRLDVKSGRILSGITIHK